MRISTSLEPPDEEAMGCRICAMLACSKNTTAIMVYLDGEETRPNLQFSPWLFPCLHSTVTGPCGWWAWWTSRGKRRNRHPQLWICCANSATRVSYRHVDYGGTASNVIPATGELEVTVRHTERSIWTAYPRKLKMIFEGASLWHWYYRRWVLRQSLRWYELKTIVAHTSSKWWPTWASILEPGLADIGAVPISVMSAINVPHSISKLRLLGSR